VTPADYMAKALRAQASAELLLADGDVEGACNRAYYAMFDAAHAAILHVDPEADLGQIRTHRGLIAAFGQRLVKTSMLDVTLGRSLNQVERLRLLSDYTGEAVEVDAARQALVQARDFVKSIAQFVSSCR
jgi:uncharacterized protein (UPF0332 family)